MSTKGAKDKRPGYISGTDANFRRFRLGISIFFTGMVFLYGCNQLMEPSLMQDIAAMISVLVISFGFILAILSEVRFVLARIIHFFHSK